MSVEDLFSRPYYSEIGLRRIQTNGDSIEERSHLYLQEINDMKSTLEESWPYPSQTIFRDSIDVVLNFWTRIGVGNIEKMKTAYRQTTEDLNKQSPKMLSGDSANYSNLEVWQLDNPSA